MGYRSEVKCIIYGRPEILDAFIAKHTMKGNKFLSELSDHITYGLITRTWYHNDGKRDEVQNKIMDFHGSEFKWYDEYLDVQGLNQLMDDIDQNYEGELDFEFVRVGEEYKDIEHKTSGNHYGYIYPTTTIINDYNMEEIPNEKD